MTAAPWQNLERYTESLARRFLRGQLSLNEVCVLMEIAVKRIDGELWSKSRTIDRLGFEIYQQNYTGAWRDD